MYDHPDLLSWNEHDAWLPRTLLVIRVMAFTDNFPKCFCVHTQFCEIHFVATLLVSHGCSILCPP